MTKRQVPRGILRNWKIVFDAPFLRHVEGEVHGHKYNADGDLVRTKSLLGMTVDGTRIFTITGDFILDPPYVKPPQKDTAKPSTVPEVSIP
jgi:hypothetical protein